MDEKYNQNWAVMRVETRRDWSAVRFPVLVFAGMCLPQELLWFLFRRHLLPLYAASGTFAAMQVCLALLCGLLSQGARRLRPDGAMLAAWLGCGLLLVTVEALLRGLGERLLDNGRELPTFLAAILGVSLACGGEKQGSRRRAMPLVFGFALILFAASIYSAGTFWVTCRGGMLLPNALVAALILLRLSAFVLLGAWAGNLARERGNAGVPSFLGVAVSCALAVWGGASVLWQTVGNALSLTVPGFHLTRWLSHHYYGFYPALMILVGWHGGYLVWLARRKKREEKDQPGG